MTTSTSTSTLPLRPHQARSLWQTAILAICGLCGFLTVFGLAHLALIQITKPGGYVFFGTLALVPSLVTLALARLVPSARSEQRGWQRFGFGAAMCLLAIPCVYLARFFPVETQATVRNLLGLPFFALALVGPGIVRRIMRRGQTAEA